MQKMVDEMLTTFMMQKIFVTSAETKFIYLRGSSDWASI